MKYYASKGNSGLYSYHILNSIENSEDVSAFVHSDFEYQLLNNLSVKRIFSVYERYVKSSILKKIYHYIDLYFTFSRIIFFVWRKSKQDKVISVVQLHQSFHSFYFLVRALSRHSSVYLTIHDAVELSHNYPSFIMVNRAKILELASGFIVHSESGSAYLESFQVPIKKYPFPLFVSPDFLAPSQTSSDIRFLFVGHLRAEKGIKKLLDCWLEIQDRLPQNVSLTVAGSNPNDYEFDTSLYKNVEFQIGFVADSQFEKLVHSHDYVVMPYSGGTNSGVLSVATSLNRPCLVSNIEMFLTHPFVLKELVFDLSGDNINAFILDVVNQHQNRYFDLVSQIKSRRNGYIFEFEKGVNHFFQKKKDVL